MAAMAEMWPNGGPNVYVLLAYKWVLQGEVFLYKGRGMPVGARS